MINCRACVPNSPSLLHSRFPTIYSTASYFFLQKHSHSPVVLQSRLEQPPKMSDNPTPNAIEQNSANADDGVNKGTAVAEESVEASVDAVKTLDNTTDPGVSVATEEAAKTDNKPKQPLDNYVDNEHGIKHRYKSDDKDDIKPQHKGSVKIKQDGGPPRYHNNRKSNYDSLKESSDPDEIRKQVSRCSKSLIVYETNES